MNAETKVQIDLPFCFVSGWACDTDSIPKEMANSCDIIGYAQIANCHGRLRELPQVQNAKHLVAWSLGALLLLEEIPFLPNAQSITLWAPFADFTAPGRGWAPRVLQRMRQRLAKAPFEVLCEFATLMDHPDSINWAGQAQNIRLEHLQWGLEALETRRVNIAQLVTTLGTNVKLEIVIGANDKVVSNVQSEHVHQAWPGSTLREGFHGHWPW